jgi:two-component system response regulator NreC
MAALRILIADDHAVIRTALAQMLDGEPDLQVVGEAGDGVQAVERAIELNPDLLLMDVTMPAMNGIEATRRIAELCPNVRIIGLSMHDDEAVISRMRAAGAVGFITKSAPIDELLDTIRREAAA